MVTAIVVETVVVVFVGLMVVGYIRSVAGRMSASLREHADHMQQRADRIDRKVDVLGEAVTRGWSKPRESVCSTRSRSS